MKITNGNDNQRWNGYDNQRCIIMIEIMSVKQREIFPSIIDPLNLYFSIIKEAGRKHKINSDVISSTLDPSPTEGVLPENVTINLRNIHEVRSNIKAHNIIFCYLYGRGKSSQAYEDKKHLMK